MEKNLFSTKLAVVYSTLVQESERGSVIVAAAFHDELLKKLLLARLIPYDNKSDYLFDGANAPAGNMHCILFNIFL